MTEVSLLYKRKDSLTYPSGSTQYSSNQVRPSVPRGCREHIVIQVQDNYLPLPSLRTLHSPAPCKRRGHKREETREVKVIPYNSGARGVDGEGDSQGLCYPHLCRRSLRSPPSAGPGGEDSQHLLRQALHLQSFGSISHQALPVSCKPK